MSPGARFLAAIGTRTWGNRAGDGMLVDLPACGTVPALKARLVHTPHFPGRTGYVPGRGLHAAYDGIPDLSDAATRGACLDVLRDVSGDRSLYTRPEMYDLRGYRHKLPPRWSVLSGAEDGAVVLEHATEAEALAAAAESWRATQPKESP